MSGWMKATYSVQIRGRSRTFATSCRGAAVGDLADPTAQMSGSDVLRRGNDVSWPPALLLTLLIGAMVPKVPSSPAPVVPPRGELPVVGRARRRIVGC
ncbi:hypothetical protein C2845_PM07G25220 [Panicum miliaceum]|uniref:Uncharacterized protein n=1 Tax=Panicum miliaceum TaxID=4540 RepID=A0A3L6SMW6_PANMI|nr:hypothetical protein C2845_PM07G25220 [Panicum miliaceum]